MRRGAHAAADGSFGRSAAAHAGRGALLLFVALLLGIVLLQSTDHTTPIGSATTPTTKSGPATTAAPAATTTTTAAAPAHDPKTVKVLAANGTATNGIGDKVRRKLLAANYDALQAVNGPKGATTQIYYQPGFQPDAAAIATVLGVPQSNVLPMPAKPPVAPGTANVVVVAGNDVVAALSATTTASTAPRAPTATTAKATTTTTAKSSSTTSSTVAHTTSSTAAATTSTTKKS